MGLKPDMLSVEKFLAQVALLPLLSNTIEVDHVLLQGAEILIEREADGRANFVFDAAAKKARSRRTKHLHHLRPPGSPAMARYRSPLS